MFHDHSKAGKYESDQSHRKIVSSIGKTNNITEKDFEILSRFIREKSNWNMISYETLVLRRANKSIPTILQKKILGYWVGL